MTSKNLSKQDKIAFFSPFRPIKSGISDYSAELLQELKNHFQITIVTNGYKANDPKITKEIEQVNFAEIKNLDEFMQNFKHAIYHMSNNVAHEYIYTTLQKFPGIVVMHDFSIAHMISEITLGKGSYADFKQELLECGFEIKEGEVKNIDKNFLPLKFIWEENAMKYDCNEKIVRNSLGIIVHSFYAKNLFSQKEQKPFIEVIPMLADKTKRPSEKKDNKIKIACFGNITFNKRYQSIIEVFQEIYEENQETELILVGEFATIDLKEEITTLINKNSSKNAIKITGHVSEEDFYKHLDQSDICVNMRYPTVGETSLSLMKIMGYGKPCLVSDTGWYAELPKNSVVKVKLPLPNLETEKTSLKKALQNLIKDEEKRFKIGENAYEYAVNFCNTKKVAELYAEFIQKVDLYQKQREQYLIKISHNLKELHIDNNNSKPSLKLIAQNISSILF